MTAWIDHKYIGILSIQLEQFRRKSGKLYNFRCPICGDSKKSRTKARGYIHFKNGGMFYMCHNCNCSMSFGNLLKQVDFNLYNQYKLERYMEGENGNRGHNTHNYQFETPKFGSSRSKNYETVLTPIKNFDENHEIIKYLRSRKIPENRYNRLYYVDDVQRLKQLAPDYEDKILTNESRLVLPFYDKSGKLVGVSARGIRGEQFRYLTIRIDQNSPMIFGLDQVDESKTIYVTEGPIDSLFLPNCVAVGNANLKAAAEVLPKEQLVLLYDNEPRNNEITKGMKAAIDDGFSLCIWPKSYQQKDINDMVVKEELSVSSLTDVVKDRTFVGARLMLEYNAWKI